MIRNTANVIRKCFDAAKDNLNANDLEWLASLDDNAACQADNAAAALNLLSTLLVSEKRNRPADEDLSYILYGLASQLETVAAMIHIIGEARYKAAEIAKQ